jgi:glutamate carboxypeptidase
MDENRLLMQSLQRELRGSVQKIVRLLAKFVKCESPSRDKAAVDRFGRIVATEWRRRGATVRILRQTTCGNHVRAELWLGEGRPAGQILVLGHLDTVYPLGTLAAMPFRVAGGRAWGPGIFDMKTGIALALFAVDALKAAKPRLRRDSQGSDAGFLRKRLVFLWNSDEEIGSDTSRREIEREARRSDTVLVLEPGFGVEGKLKTARKGVGSAEILVTGRSAHAGLNPAAGVNAVHELALQIARLMKMNNPRRGITVQATVIAGGTVSNVVPAHARAEVDIRYGHVADAAGLDRKLLSLRPILPSAQIEVRGGMNRPPLERTPAVVELFLRAQSLARELNLSLGEVSVGGGSDGNFTAALGVPTLDGLGAVGGGAHSPSEHVIMRDLPTRAALLAGLLASF